MLLVPRGIAKRRQSCLYTSRPIAVWCCLKTVAAAAVVALIRMYLRLLASCIQRSASAGVPAAAVSSAFVNTVVAVSAFDSNSGYMLSCMPMYALNLCFHSLNVA